MVIDRQYIGRTEEIEVASIRINQSYTNRQPAKI